MYKQLSLEDLIKKTKKIHNINQIVRSLCCEFESIHLDKLCEFIKQNPVLSNDIIKKSNDVLFGSNKKIKSLRQAISILGKNGVYPIIINDTLQHTIKFDDIYMYDINAIGLQYLNTSRSIFLKNLCNELKIDKEIFNQLNTVSMFSIIGIVLCAVALEFNQQGETFKKLKSDYYIPDLEKKLLGYSSYDVVYTMFKHWQLEDILIFVSHELPYFGNEYLVDKNNIKTYAFIITTIHYIIRSDGKFKLDSKIVDIFKKTGLGESNLINAFKKSFGDTMIETPPANCQS